MKRRCEWSTSPFQCGVLLRPMERAEFDRMSRCIMEHAFASENELCDGDFLEADPAVQVQTDRLSRVARQTPLMVHGRDLAKTYFLDLIVQGAFMVELKAGAALAGEHENQLLNYLFLLDVLYGKLINFGLRSTEYRRANAVESTAERYNVQFHTERRQPVGERCELLRARLTELFSVWGAFLDVYLYEKALIRFVGSRNAVMRVVPMARSGSPPGNKRLPVLNEHVGLQMTALSAASAKAYESQARRFLAITT